MMLIRTLFFTIICLSSSVVFAAGDEAAGKEKATVCQSCHGATGNESITPDIPKLAGQHEDYLIHALSSYRSGDRQQAVMSTFASQLSDQDIEDLAAYFSGQNSQLSHIVAE